MRFFSLQHLKSFRHSPYSDEELWAHEEQSNELDRKGRMAYGFTGFGTLWSAFATQAIYYALINDPSILAIIVEGGPTATLDTADRLKSWISDNEMYCETCDALLHLQETFIDATLMEVDWKELVERWIDDCQQDVDNHVFESNLISLNVEYEEEWLAQWLNPTVTGE